MVGRGQVWRPISTLYWLPVCAKLKQTTRQTIDKHAPPSWQGCLLDPAKPFPVVSPVCSSMEIEWSRLDSRRGARAARGPRRAGLDNNWKGFLLMINQVICADRRNQWGASTHSSALPAERLGRLACRLNAALPSCALDAGMPSRSMQRRRRHLVPINHGGFNLV